MWKIVGVVLSRRSLRSSVGRMPRLGFWISARMLNIANTREGGLERLEIEYATR
jgi:hypothetical protein